MATFRQSVEATIPALRRYARALTRDADIADDLVQDTLVRALRSEHLFHGIRVNAIAPGEIDTSILSPGTEEIVARQIPLHRLGTPDEVAKIVYVLCTETGSYVNGAEIHINGGQHV